MIPPPRVYVPPPRMALVRSGGLRVFSDVTVGVSLSDFQLVFCDRSLAPSHVFLVPMQMISRLYGVDPLLQTITGNVFATGPYLFSREASQRVVPGLTDFLLLGESLEQCSYSMSIDALINVMRARARGGVVDVVTRSILFSMVSGSTTALSAVKVASFYGFCPLCLYPSLSSSPGDPNLPSFTQFVNLRDAVGATSLVVMALLPKISQVSVTTRCSSGVLCIGGGPWEVCNLLLELSPLGSLSSWGLLLVVPPPAPLTAVAVVGDLLLWSLVVSWTVNCDLLFGVAFSAVRWRASP
ncbi:hypothetical protein Tco_0765832 [Tanacetum coccineum]